MKLSGEIRNKIYAYLFADKAVHVETIPGQRQSDDVATHFGLVAPKVRGRLCQYHPSSHDCFLNMVGPASQEWDTSSVDDPKLPAHLAPDFDREWCTDDRSICCGEWFTDNSTVLSLQLLRTCKKIHSEAALIPYTETFFMIHDDCLNTPDHEEALRRSLGHHQSRCAIRNAAFRNLRPRLFEQIPSFFPQLQRVWIDLYDAPIYELEGTIPRFHKNPPLVAAVVVISTFDGQGWTKSPTALRIEKALLGDTTPILNLSIGP